MENINASNILFIMGTMLNEYDGEINDNTLILLSSRAFKIYKDNFYNTMHPAMEFKPQYKGIQISISDDMEEIKILNKNN